MLNLNFKTLHTLPLLVFSFTKLSFEDCFKSLPTKSAHTVNARSLLSEFLLHKTMSSTKHILHTYLQSIYHDWTLTLLGVYNIK